MTMKVKYCAYAAVIAVSIMLIMAGTYINQGQASYSQGAKLQSQEFLANGTYTVATGISLIYVSVLGAGGGGGSAANPTVVMACGGGAGEYIYRHPLSVSAGQQYTVTIGLGGYGSRNFTDNYAAGPVAGDDTSFGSLLVAKGGKGSGTTQNANCSTASAGGGITTSTSSSMFNRGDSFANRYGGAPTAGYTFAQFNNSIIRIANGGAGYRGTGGEGAIAPETNGSSPAANSGAGGGGGYGSSANDNEIDTSGGRGGSGYVLVEWVG